MSRADLDTQRALFEAWARESNGSPARLKGTDQYLVENVQAAWKGWQAALAAQTPVQGDAEDAARLDWLESMGNEPEGILLHDGGDFTGRRGLGLRRIGRTLRAAIDAARKAAT